MKDTDITALVEGLNSLHDGDQVLGRILCVGRPAIPVLRSFLAGGRPSGIYQPRWWAVEGLGALGAKDALIEYLDSTVAIGDPVIRAGEEAVQNAAARELARWQTEDVFEALSRIAARRPTSGVIEALGFVRREESIPIFDRALQDDFTRDAAESAFRKLGDRARPALILSALTSLPTAAEETTSSLRRRNSALGLLLGIGVDPAEWPLLRALLEEVDPGIVVSTTELALRVAPRADQIAAGHAILRVLPSAPWDIRMEAPDCLARCMPELAGALENELQSRHNSPTAAVDPVLSVLLRAKRIANEQNGRPPD